MNTFTTGFIKVCKAILCIPGKYEPPSSPPPQQPVQTVPNSGVRLPTPLTNPLPVRARVRERCFATYMPPSEVAEAASLKRLAKAKREASLAELLVVTTYDSTVRIHRKVTEPTKEISGEQGATSGQVSSLFCSKLVRSF